MKIAEVAGLVLVALVVPGGCVMALLEWRRRHRASSASNALALRLRREGLARPADDFTQDPASGWRIGGGAR